MRGWFKGRESEMVGRRWREIGQEKLLKIGKEISGCELIKRDEWREIDRWRLITRD